MTRVIWIGLLAFALAACTDGVVGAFGEWQQQSLGQQTSAVEPQSEANKQLEDTMAGPPELGIAVVAEGQVIEVRRFKTQMFTRVTQGEFPPGFKVVEMKQGTVEPEPKVESISLVETQITRIQASEVIVRRIDNREISTKELIDALASPRPIILVRPSQTIDPLFLKMFDPESLVFEWPPTKPSPTIEPVTRPPK